MIGTHLLRSAVVLSEELNYARASQRLGITQSGLSKQICELERHVRQRLFDRDRQHVRITRAGQILVEHASQAIALIDQAMDKLHPAHHVELPHLHIGKSPQIDPFYLSMLRSLRLPNSPQLRLRFTSGFPSDLTDQLLRGDLHLALTNLVGDIPRLSVFPLKTHPLAVLLRSSDSLASKPALSVQDLHKRPLIVHERRVDSILFDRTEQVFRDQAVVPSEVHSVIHAEEARQHLLQHTALAILSPTCAWRVAGKTLTIRPLHEPGLRIQTCLVARSEETSRTVAEFLRVAITGLKATPSARQIHLPFAS